MHRLLTASVNINEESVGNIISKVTALDLMGVVKIVVLAIVLLVIIRLLNGFAKKFIERSKIDKSIHGFLEATIKIILYFLGIMVLAGSLDIDVTSLIAVFSVAGLALSLALQGVLGNVAGGIVILTTKPMHVGDYVAIGGSEGTVDAIGMTYTTLSTADNRLVYIPNSTVTGSTVMNYTVSGKRRVDLSITASYDCRLEDVRAALLDAASSVDTLLKDEEIFARVTAYNDSNITYQLRGWSKTEDYWTTYFDLLEAVKVSFDRSGIVMTYPHLNVHLDK